MVPLQGCSGLSADLGNMQGPTKEPCWPTSKHAGFLLCRSVYELSADQVTPEALLNSDDTQHIVTTTQSCYPMDTVSSLSEAGRHQAGGRSNPTATAELDEIISR